MERGAGESSVSWSLASFSLGCLNGDTQHSKPAFVCIWETSNRIPIESSENRKTVGVKTAQRRLFFWSLQNALRKKCLGYLSFSSVKAHSIPCLGHVVDLSTAGEVKATPAHGWPAPSRRSIIHK